MSGIDTGEATHPRSNRLRVVVKRALIVVAAMTALAVVGVAGFAAFLNHTVTSNVHYADLLPTPSPTPTSTTNGQLATPTVDTQNHKATNILVIGSDARPGDTFSRSDVIILVHIPESWKNVYLIHFPRDLYVPIPGHGKDKINAAYAYGGAPLLVQTLQDMLGIRIDHVAKTDFPGFKAMTDAVGGVRVWAEEATNGTGNGGPVVIHHGWNDLNGTQALAFVRERYLLSEGDISRGRRELAFLKALLLKVTSTSTLTNPIAIARFVDAASKDLVVDRSFTMDVMRGYALSLRNIRSSDVAFVTAPFSGFATTSAGASIDVVDQAGMDTLGRLLRADEMSNYSHTYYVP